jgi:hypothetical protein
MEVQRNNETKREFQAIQDFEVRRNNETTSKFKNDIHELKSYEMVKGLFAVRGPKRFQGIKTYITVALRYLLMCSLRQVCEPL